MAVTEQQKAQLKALGKWAEFYKRRTALRYLYGLSPKNAETQAIAEFLGGTPTRKLKKRGKTRRVGGEGAVASTLPHVPKAAQGFTRDTAQIDADETVNMLDVVSWVFKHLSVEDTRPEDAPNPGAWSLLCRARASGENMDWFLEKFCTRLVPTHQTIDDAKRPEDDGSPCDTALRHLGLDAGHPALLSQDGGGGAEKAKSECEVPA